MNRVFPLVLCLAMVGCSTVGRIKTKLATVTGVPEAGKPAFLDESTDLATLPLPAGSRLVMTKFAASAAVPATEHTAEVPAQPAKEVTEVVLSRDSEWRRNETRVQADTGTVDQSVAKHRIDVADRAKLLYASMAMAFLAGIFFYIKYPTPALMCAAASVVAFLAWKLSDLPDWFWVLSVCLVVGAIHLWRGHVRGESDGVKAALAGEVEPKNPPVVKS